MRTPRAWLLFMLFLLKDYRYMNFKIKKKPYSLSLNYKAYKSL